MPLYSHSLDAHFQVKITCMLWSTISRPVCLGIKHPSGADDQTFITLRQLQVCWSETLALSRGYVVVYNCCWPLRHSHSRVRVQWESRPYFTASNSRLPFRRLVQLARIRWKYSTPPPHGNALIPSNWCPYIDPARMSITVNVSRDPFAASPLARSLLYSNGLAVNHQKRLNVKATTDEVRRHCACVIWLDTKKTFLLYCGCVYVGRALPSNSLTYHTEIIQQDEGQIYNKTYVR
jgi:hypothetical protein